uniref:Multidrug and toxin extrusion protein n=1 Tax=Sus scrofa TaxID=9823 RepID=A0A8D1ESK1_PIG
METPAAPAPETPVAAPDGAQCPRVPGWRRCLRGLRGALPPDVGREVVELVMLAGPVFLAQLMTFLISIVSSIFCGHLGRAELDAVMLAVSVVNVSGISIGTGLASACDTLMSQSFGGRNLKRVGVILQRGVLILLLCCLPCWAIFINTESLLRLLKQDPEVSRSAASPACICFLFYLQATFLFQLQAKYLQNQPKRVGVGLLLFGRKTLAGDKDPFSFRGSAWANTTSQFFLCALLFLYLRWKKIHVDTLGGWGRAVCFQSHSRGRAGSRSRTRTPGHPHIRMLGSSHLSSVRVGNALGAGNPEQARHSGVTVLLCAGVCALVISTVLAALKDVVAYAFTRDKAIISLVSRVMPIFAPFHLFDALAGTSGGVLRGTGKQKMGAFSNAIGYYVFGFPLGVSLMFAAHHGIIGECLVPCVCLCHLREGPCARTSTAGTVSRSLRTELPILEKDGPRGVILPDVVRPERQATQLMGTEGSDQDAVPTVGAVLTGGQLLLYRGLACALAVATLAAGVAVRLLHGRG